MTYPAVSIVIPCYNKRPYVAAAIESALAQGDLAEVIVVDDGSTDGSAEVVAGYDARIRWETGPNRGGSAARNRGLALAQGRFIQFLDADDILPAEKVALQLACLAAAPEDAMALGPWSFLHDDGRVEAPDARSYWSDHADGLSMLLEMWTWGGFFPPHAWLVPRSLIDAVGPWDERLSSDDDGEFFGRLLTRAGPVRFVEEARVLYRRPPYGSVSRDRSLSAARSSWLAFETVAGRIRERRADAAARRACLGRARRTAYAWANVEEVVAQAAAYERENGLLDFSPSLPRGARVLVGLLGISRGLKVRRMLSGGV